MAPLRILFTCLLLAAVAAEVDLPELREQPHDILVLRKGNEQLLGTIVSIDENGTVFFRVEGDETGHVGYREGSYLSYSRRRMAPDIIRQRVELIAQHRHEIVNPGKRMRETLAWGLKKGEVDLVTSMAASAAASVPESTDLARWVIEQFGQDAAGLAGLEEMIRAVVEVNPEWIEGREYLLRIYENNEDLEALQAQLDILLRRHPQHLLANRAFAGIAYRSGELEKAQRSFRIVKGRDPEDHAARAGYAKCSLLLGQFRRAAQDAEVLREAGVYRRDAAVILGTVALRQEEPAVAEELLAEALNEDDAESRPLDPRLRTIARSNLALAHLRNHRPAAAAEIWSELDGEYARVGLALARGELIAADQLENGHLRSVANEHNLCLELQKPNPEITELRAQLSVGRVPRHTFLDRVAGMVESRGERISVRAVRRLGEGENEDEALRWAAYGHLLAGRYTEAEELLGRLPTDDGYAAIYRVYIAAARKDMDGAQSLYKKLVEPLATRTGMTVPPPRDYVQSLAAHFDVMTSQFRRFDFDIDDGELLGPSWRSLAQGTGIRIHIHDEHLVFSGTQRESRTPVSRAWCTTLKSQFSEAWLFFDASGAREAMVGMEVLDHQLRNGVAVGMDGERELKWRSISRGRAGPWQAFSPRRHLSGGKPLRLAYRTGNRVALIPDASNDPVFVGDPLSIRDKVAVVVFGEADAGTTWSLRVDRLDLR